MPPGNQRPLDLPHGQWRAGGIKERDETTIDVMRPILLTGIDSPATRGDLLDRALVVTLPAMSDEARGDEADLWRRYHEMRPTALGAVCDAVSAALRRQDAVQLLRRPRMADACRWVTAAAAALGWDDKRIVCTWLGARADASADLLATDSVGQALLRLPDERLPWHGTSAALLAVLSEHVHESIRTGRSWPNSARGLAAALRRLAPDLRRAGLSIELPTHARTARERIITIRQERAGPDKQDIPDRSADLLGGPDDAPGPVGPTGHSTGLAQDARTVNESSPASDLSDLSGSSQACQTDKKGVHDGRF